MPVPVDLEAFCAAEHARLVGAPGLYCGDRHLAEDLAQDALAKLCQHWAQVRQMQFPAAWLHCVAINLANSHFRRRRIASGLLRLERRVDTAPPLEAAPDVIAALGRLSGRERQVVVLRYYLQHTTPEIAVALRLSEGTVRSVLHRANAKLRLQLGDYATGVTP